MAAFFFGPLDDSFFFAIIASKLISNAFKMEDIFSHHKKLVLQNERNECKSAFTIKNIKMLKLRRHFCSALPEKLVYKDIRKADRIEYPTLDIELNSLPKLKPGKELNAPVVEYSTLKNGLRIVSQETYGQASTIGLFVNAGSRYENKTNAGINHMMQHMSFKSSDSRSHGAFVQQLEDIGASVTANGSREQLIYTMDVLRDHIDSGMEMLADSVLNPLLVESELKGIRNILKYEHENEMEDPQAFVQEIVHQAAYGNDSPLGRKCMAQKENIDKLSKDMVLEYRNKHFVAEKMVLCGAGVNHERLVALANKYFSQVKQGTDSKDEKWITPKYTGGQVQLEDKSLPFAYGAMAFETKGWHDEGIPIYVSCDITLCCRSSLGVCIANIVRWWEFIFSGWTWKRHVFEALYGTLH